MVRATLTQHLDEQGVGSAELRGLITAFGDVGRKLSRAIGEAVLRPPADSSVRDRVGSNADEGIDPIVAALQTQAHDIVREHLASTGCVALLASAHRAEPEIISTSEHGRFVVYVDPLDGLANAGINGELGSIFGAYRREGELSSRDALLRGGAEQVAAGYVLYGASTMLVYTTGAGVQGYTLDRTRDEFVLTHAHIRCPDHGGWLAANLSRAGDWAYEIREFVEHVTRGLSQRGRYSLRFSGAVVADLHQSLLRGGVTFYPADREHENGALQLLNDCAPLAMIAEQAGGKASTGHDRILDMRAYSLHEHCPLVIGSVRDVELFEQFMCGRVRPGSRSSS